VTIIAAPGLSAVTARRWPQLRWLGCANFAREGWNGCNRRGLGRFLFVVIARLFLSA
jgi:hypothetical protein